MSENDSGRCGCSGDLERSETDPAYRRALRLVVVLNIGFQSGRCEHLKRQSEQA